MMPEPSSAPDSEGVDPEVEPEGDPKGGPDIDQLFDRPDAASMEGAINKFMEGLEGQERTGFAQIHRLLSRLPVPVQKKTRIMTHAEAWSSSVPLKSLTCQLRGLWRTLGW